MKITATKLIPVFEKLRCMVFYKLPHMGLCGHTVCFCRYETNEKCTLHQTNTQHIPQLQILYLLHEINHLSLSFWSIYLKTAALMILCIEDKESH